MLLLSAIKVSNVEVSTNLCRVSSSSPLIGSRPPSNTMMGSTPCVRSNCTRDMKYETYLCRRCQQVGAQQCPWVSSRPCMLGLLKQSGLSMVLPHPAAGHNVLVFCCNQSAPATAIRTCPSRCLRRAPVRSSKRPCAARNSHQQQHAVPDTA